MNLREYVKERDKAVLKGDINSFKEFLDKAFKAGAISAKVYSDFMNSNETIQQMTIEKMALQITTMPIWRKHQAKTWLIEHRNDGGNKNV